MVIPMDRIELNPIVCNGRPVIKGTRIPISVILEQIAEGESWDTLLAGYPELEKEDIRAQPCSMPGHSLTTQRLEQLVFETLKVYLDQMFRLDVAQALRAEGHDVVRASEVGQARANDQQILQKAIAENRILITLDEHFGDWVILPLRQHPGVIRLKVNPATSKNVINLLLPFLRLYSSVQFKNHLVMLSPKRSKWIHTA